MAIPSIADIACNPPNRYEVWYRFRKPRERFSAWHVYASGATCVLADAVRDESAIRAKFVEAQTLCETKILRFVSADAALVLYQLGRLPTDIPDAPAPYTGHTDNKI